MGFESPFLQTRTRVIVESLLSFLICRYFYDNTERRKKKIIGMCLGSDTVCLIGRLYFYFRLMRAFISLFWD